MRVLVPLLLAALGCREAAAPAPAPAPAGERCLVPCADIRFGAHVADQVPPLDGPLVVAATAASYLGADDPVVGVAVGDAARAYPLKVLAQHEVVNDVLGGRPIAVALAPLSGVAVVIDLRATGAPRGFGNTGGTYESDSVLYDRDTGSWWSPMLLRAIRGPRLGAELRCVPHLRATWAAWRALAPSTTVLSDATGHPELDYSSYAYAWYEADDRQLLTTLRRYDLRLPYKEPVLGLVVGAVARAYPASRLPIRGAIADAVGGRAVLVVRDAAAGLLAAYDRTMGPTVLDFVPLSPDDAGVLRLRDVQTGSRWDARGRALAGPLAGSALAPAASTRAYWFAWGAFHPASEIWSAGNGGDA